MLCVSTISAHVLHYLASCGIHGVMAGRILASLASQVC